MTADRKVKLFAPPLHRGQLEVIRSRARFNVVACGRRWGKSLVALVRALKAIEQPEARIWYIAPTFPMVDLHWRTFRSMLPEGVPVTFHQQSRRAVFANGAEVSFHSSSDPDRLRGPGLHGVILDEAAFMVDGDRLLNEVLRPALADKRGWMLALSTPCGHNHFSAWYHRGLGGDEAWRSFRFPTSTNPHIPPDEIESARLSMPDRVFQQEFLAEFVEDGAVFRRVREAVAEEAPTAAEGARIVFGVDWAKAEDYTVCVALNADTGAVVAVDRYNQVSWALQRARIGVLRERFAPRVILVETNSIGEPQLEELQREGIPVQGFQTTAQSKPPLIDALALAFEQGRLTLPPDPVLVAELQAYTMTRTPSGRYQYSAPPGQHDDCVMALALAWDAAGRASGVVEWW